MAPVDRPRRRPSRIRRPHSIRFTLLFTAAAVLLTAVVLAIAGIGTILRNPVGGAALLVSGTVALAGAEWFRRLARPDGPQLTVCVAADEVTFEHPRAVVGRVARHRGGVVVLGLQPGRFGGVDTITVWEPEGALVGRWETSWLGKGAIGAYRTLRRHGWPAAIADSSTAKMRWISDDAPSWMPTRRGWDAYLRPERITFDPAQVDWAAFAHSLDPPPAARPAPAPTNDDRREVRLTPALPGPCFAIDLAVRWCILTDVPDDNAVELARCADALTAETPGLCLTRETLVTCMSFSAVFAGHGTVVAVTCVEDARFGVVCPTIRMSVIERPKRLVGLRLFARFYQLADALGGARYRPRVHSVGGTVPPGQRTHSLREETNAVDGQRSFSVVLRHWIPIGDRRFTVELETTTANLGTARQLAGEVDVAAASVREVAAVLGPWPLRPAP